MATGILTRKEVKKRHKAKHKKLGLCIYCSKKSIEGQTMCEHHKEYHKKKRQLSTQFHGKVKE